MGLRQHRINHISDYISHNEHIARDELIDAMLQNLVTTKYLELKRVNM
jgi:hypothetical protein